MTDQRWVETAQARVARGSGCPRCEETAGISVFRERYRTVARSHGFVRFLAAGVLLVLSGELLLTGRTTGAAVAFALGSLAAASFVRTTLRSRPDGPVAVLHCHHCATRYPV